MGFGICFKDKKVSNSELEVDNHNINDKYNNTQNPMKRENKIVFNNSNIRISANIALNKRDNLKLSIPERKEKDESTNEKSVPNNKIFKNNNDILGKEFESNNKDIVIVFNKKKEEKVKNDKVRKFQLNTEKVDRIQININKPQQNNKQ